jgi:hypothetical protein
MEETPMTTTNDIFIAEIEPTSYVPFQGSALACMSTLKLLSTWQELDAHGRKTKNGFPVQLDNIESAIRSRVAVRLHSMGFQVIY